MITVKFHYIFPCGSRLHIFNHFKSTLSGIMKQVDKAMAKDEAERLKKIYTKDLNAIKDDIQ